MVVYLTKMPINVFRTTFFWAFPLHWSVEISLTNERTIDPLCWKRLRRVKHITAITIMRNLIDNIKCNGGIQLQQSSFLCFYI